MNQADIQTPITELLQAWRGGDDGALEQLTPAVYAELSRIAMGFMRGERRGHSLTTGDLVHEAFLRMVGERDRSIENRLHFFALASKMMKDFLVEHARARKAQKRGGALPHVTLGHQDHLPCAVDDGRIMFLTEAIDALLEQDARSGRILEMYYYVGLGVPEIAQVLQISPATVKRELQFARAWLKHRFGGDTS